MNLILLLILLTSNVAHSFDGIIDYEIEDTQKNIDGKQHMKLGIKKHLMYFDMGKMIDNKFVSSMKVITDFNQKKFTAIVKNNVKKRKFDKPFIDPSFISPEETLTLKTKKSILGFETEEFETFYFSDKVRLPIKEWFATSLEMVSNKPVWHFHKFNEQLAFLNLLFNPVSKKIALEISIDRADKTKKTYIAKKVERIQLDDSQFETFSGEGILHYEGYHSKSPKKKIYLTMALKSDVIRFNTSYKPNDTNAISRALVLDYNEGIFISRNRKQVDIDKMQSEMKNKKITIPDEVKSTSKKKTIAGMPVEEFESTYVEDDKKVVVNMWYTPKLYLYYFNTVSSLYNVASDLGLTNLFVHPVTKQIALEVTFQKSNGTFVTFKCVKWEEKSISNDYFNMAGKTFSPY